jgi:glycosyltransferase involved in cell wall biosynthesis
MGSTDWKTVSTIYDIPSQIPRSTHKAMLMRIFDEYGAKWSLSRYEGILVRTPIQARFVAEMGIDESRIHLTPPGVSPDDFHRPSEDQVERARRIYAPEDESVILYVGRLHPIKGIDVLIEATERIISSGQDVKTLLVGPDGNGYVNTLKRKAQDLGIGSSVVSKGDVEEEEKRMLQSLCDLSVLPSSFEGFGQSLVQAMAKGTPVIGTSVGGIPWLLEDGESGLLVEYGNVGQLSEAMARILCDSHLSKRYAKRGKRRASDFAYPNLVEDLEAIYREVLSST